MLIEVKGVQFVNKGAELMLLAITEQIAELWPDAEICLQPRLNSSYLNRAKLGAYQKLNLRKGKLDLNRFSYWLPSGLRSYLKRAWGIVTEADVDVILDASGFSYGDQWPDIELIQAAKEAKRLKEKNKHYIFMPQALGPFTQSNNVHWATLAFTHADSVFARDEVSLNAIQALGTAVNLSQSCDFTNLISAELDKQYQYLAGAVAVIPNSKMVSRQNSDAKWRDKYIDTLIDTINILQSKGLSVFLLNHEGKKDDNICQAINAQLAAPIEIVAPKNALQVKAIIGQCLLTVCSRFHGCVSSLSQGIPCVGTSWSHKYEQLFSEYGQQDLLLSASSSTEQLSEILVSALENNKAISSDLMVASDTYKQQTQQMWARIKQNIAG